MLLTPDNKLKKLIVIGDRILIKPVQPDQRTVSGLYLPPGVPEKEKVQQGYVIKTGPGYAIPLPVDESWKTEEEQIKYIPLQAKEGDLAIFLLNGATEVAYQGDKYFIVPKVPFLCWKETMNGKTVFWKVQVTEMLLMWLNVVHRRCAIAKLPETAERVSCSLSTDTFERISQLIVAINNNIPGMKKWFLLTVIFYFTTSFSKKEIQWVAIGDSITYLNDHTIETGKRVSKGYMTMISDQLPGVHYTNQGHNGWTSGGIADSIETLGIGTADIYSVFLGTNDWWQGRPVGGLSDYQNNTGSKTLFGAFRIITNKLRTLDKNARIILLTPMQRSDFVYIGNMSNNAFGSYKEKNGQSLEQFADAINSIAHYEHFQVVDLYHSSELPMKKLVKFKRLKDPGTMKYKDYPYPDFIGRPFNPITDEYPYPVDAVGLTFDGLHPSDMGYAIIAKLLVKEIKNAVGIR